MSRKKVIESASSLTTREKLISVFIIVNLGTVLYMNRPQWVVQPANRFVQSVQSAQSRATLRKTSWFIKQYAHAIGIDNEWQMFGRQSRFNWWFTIRANYADGKSIVLPLPLQSPRSVVDKYFFDYKEGKFHLNLYPSVELRQRYAYYLCRQHPTREGAAIDSIRYERSIQHLHTMSDSAKYQTHLKGPISLETLETFPCPRRSQWVW